MYLQNLHLLNFKNYETLTLSYGNVNCIVGTNGSGKTNLLDAIHYLGLGKSSLPTTDIENIKEQEDFFLIQGTFKNVEEDYLVSCSIKTGQRKVIQCNKQPYTKISQHVGKFPIVLIAPHDTDLIREGSDLRRKFFDNLISQVNPVYLENLIQYNHVLQQRNTLLKQFHEKKFLDQDLIDFYDEKLITLGQGIYEIRKNIISDFVPFFINFYISLSQAKEKVNLVYQSELVQENFKEIFKKSFFKDQNLQRTTKGVHKDDFLFEINETSLRKYGSQGQQKSFVIALKLAQCALIKANTEKSAILLLDDIFDKLDPHRMEQLLEIVTQEDFGQVFITDAHPQRMQMLFEKQQKKAKIFTIRNGNLFTQNEL